MLTRFHPIENLQDLRNYVNNTICNHFQLNKGTYQLTERVLFRRGKPCGILFYLYGPRAVRFTAIWEMENNQVLFYNPNGERYLKTNFFEGSHLDSVAA